MRDPEVEIFDRTFEQQDFPDNAAGELPLKLVQLCTVRQEKMEDVSLGSLFWMLKALQSKRAGASVLLTDFYDRPHTSNEGIRQLMALLGMQDDKNINFQTAEGVTPNHEAWEMFCDYVREHKDERSSWKNIGTVDQGIDAVLSTEGYEVPPQMKRFLEEFSVWVDSINDPCAVQIMNHEEETAGWVRRVYPEAKKQFWRVVLPMVNEFRGKYKETLQGTTSIVQRRIQDLPEKLARLGDGKEPKAMDAFYAALFKDLVGACTYACEQERREWPEEERGVTPTDICVLLLQIEPKLVAFYISQLRDEEIRELHSLSFVRPHAEEEKPHPVIALMDSMVMMGRASLASPTPTLAPLQKLAVALRRNYAVEVTRGKSGEALNILLLDERFPMQDLCEFWRCFIESGVPREAYGHPVATKIAESTRDTPHRDMWLPLRAIYLKSLQGAFYPVSKIALGETPIVKRVLDEIAQEQPGELYKIARSKFDEFDIEEGLINSAATNQEIGFLLDVIARYLATGDTQFSGEVNMLKERLKKWDEEGI